MPRPKRTKVASTVPTRVMKSSKSTTTIPPSAQKPGPPIDHVSDDSDGLIVRAIASHPVRRSLFRQEDDQNSEDLTMAGGLAVEEKNNPISTRPRRRGPPIRSSNGRKSTSSRATRSSSTLNRTPVQEPLSGRSQRNMLGTHGVDVEERKVDEDLLETYNFHTGADEESSMLDPSLLTFGSLDSDSPAHGTRPPSAIKVGATPGHETSVLALKNFKRRPRQLSLLHQTYQTTDVEDNNDNDLDSPNNSDDLEDFLPAAVSTPIQRRESELGQQTNPNSGLSLASNSSRGKKRKLSPVIQVPRSSPPYDPPSGPDVSISQRSSSPSLPDVIVETQESPRSQDHVLGDTDKNGDEEPEQRTESELSETMAPPMSSSPTASDGEEPIRPRRVKPSSKSQKTAFSTAKLQALLPRRRIYTENEDRDEHEVDGSEDMAASDSEEDELQMPTSRLRHKASKSKQKTTKKSTVVTRKSRRTYGRRISSDKENESTDVANIGSDDETAIPLPQSKMAAITKRFEDVDAWEMDFESIDVTGGSSSPWR